MEESKEDGQEEDSNRSGKITLRDEQTAVYQCTTKTRDSVEYSLQPMLIVEVAPD